MTSRPLEKFNSLPPTTRFTNSASSVKNGKFIPRPPSRTICSSPTIGSSPIPSSGEPRSPAPSASCSGSRALHWSAVLIIHLRDKDELLPFAKVKQKGCRFSAYLYAW